MHSIVNILIRALMGVLCVLISAGLVSAAPSITSFSGQLVHGSSLTINGTAFGTKAVAAPLKYDDFEAGTPGSNLTGWSISNDCDSDGGVGSFPQYSTIHARGGASTKSAKNTFDAVCVGGSRNGGPSNASNFAILNTRLPEIYLDFWYYLDSIRPYSRNHKLWRIHSNTWTPNIYWQIYCETQIRASLIQDMTSGNYPPNQYDAQVNVETSFGPTGPQLLNGKWTHFQVYLKESGAGQYNGTAEVWMDGVKIVDRVNNFWNHGPNESGAYWDSLYFGNYFAHNAGVCPAHTADGHTFWDNVYVDTTRSRVELCDSPTWNSRKHCEIQIPQAWSPNEISVKLNQGTFSTLNNKGLFLYITDANGLVNQNGFPLCPKCPGNPSFAENLSGSSIPARFGQPAL